jgi:hypothetical protein
MNWIYNNIPIKKVSYAKRKGFIDIKLYDGSYNVIYKNRINLNNKSEIDTMLTDLKAKGANLFHESTWF